jgi:hypothetical protein
MKVTLMIVGIVLLVVGAIWVLQGLNLIAGGAMSGHKKWVLIGGTLAVVGVVLGIVAIRLKKRAA